MKKYLIFSLLFVFALTLQAQEEMKEANHSCEDVSCDGTKIHYGPQKGEFTTAMVFGRGAYFNGGLVVPSSYSSAYNAGYVSGNAPYNNEVDANNNNITNMVGVEGRYYVSSKIAISLSGGAILRNTPSQLYIPAVTDVNGHTIIPAYNAVVADERIDVNVSVGAQYVFRTKNERMFPYLGIALPFDYARRSLYDPTVIVDDNDNNETIVDLGPRHVDVTAWSAQAVAGIDYYLAKGLFLGFDVKPVSYTYATNMKVPGPGLPGLEAETDTVSFFAQFSFKLGFKF